MEEEQEEEQSSGLETSQEDLHEEDFCDDDSDADGRVKTVKMVRCLITELA